MRPHSAFSWEDPAIQSTIVCAVNQTSNGWSLTLQCKVKGKRASSSLWRRNSREMKEQTWKMMCLVFMSLCLVPQVQLSIQSLKLTIYEDLGQVTAWNFPVAPEWQAIHFTDCEAFRIKFFANIFPKGSKWPTAVYQETAGMVLSKTLLLSQALSYKVTKWPSPVPKSKTELLMLRVFRSLSSSACPSSSLHRFFISVDHTVYGLLGENKLRVRGQNSVKSIFGKV